MLNIMNKEKGFTLIELMIVVAIIGILAAIAIPQFANYRVKAFNAAAQSDLHSAQTTFENFFNENSSYPNAVTATAGTSGQVGLTDGTNTDSMNISNGVYFGSTAGTGNQSYGAATKHTSGDMVISATSAGGALTETAGTKGTALASGDLPAAP